LYELRREQKSVEDSVLIFKEERIIFVEKKSKEKKFSRRIKRRRRFESYK
jgi:hypothetical protein